MERIAARFVKSVCAAILYVMYGVIVLLSSMFIVEPEKARIQ